MSDFELNPFMSLPHNDVEKVVKLEHDKNELLNRIEKALEYIDKHMYEEYCYVGSEDRLKEILKGDKE